MSRRTKQPVASRRIWRAAEHPPQRVVEFGFAESQRVVLNPVFYCENGGPSQQKPSQAEHLRCVYGPGSLGALVYDPTTTAGSSSGIGNGKPLPLPPYRAHHRGGARVGPAVMVAGPHGRLLRRRARHQHQDDPFLAAYVACTSKGFGGEKVNRQHRDEKTRSTMKGQKKGGDVVQQGCGVSWASRVKYAGAAMSCRNVCAVDVRARDVPVAAEKEKAEVEKAEAAPTLDLSWAPVVLSARAMERRREQR